MIQNVHPLISQIIHRTSPLWGTTVYFTFVFIWIMTSHSFAVLPDWATYRELGYFWNIFGRKKSDLRLYFFATFWATFDMKYLKVFNPNFHFFCKAEAILHSTFRRGRKNNLIFKLLMPQLRRREDAFKNGCQKKWRRNIF